MRGAHFTAQCPNRQAPPAARRIKKVKGKFQKIAGNQGGAKGIAAVKGEVCECECARAPMVVPAA